MFKKGLLTIIFIVFLTVMTACSSLPISGLNVSVISSQLTSSSASTIQSNLGMGILSLEGTDQSITTSQASELLPLWKAVKNLSSDSNTTSTEIQALYAQIEGTLTADQKKAIGQMTFTDAEINSLMDENGLNVITVFEDTTSSSTSSSSSGGMGGPGGGAPMGGGEMMGGEMGAVDMGGGTQSASGNSSGGASAPAASVRNLNLIFADTVIQLLEKVNAA